jgi:hypothetical protein
MTFQIIEGDVVVRDAEGNPVGVVLDGTTYRFAVDAKAQITDEDGGIVDVNTEGSRTALSIEYPELLSMVSRMSAQLEKILQHVAIITDEDPEEPFS